MRVVNGTLFARGVVALAALLLVLGVAGTLRAQEGPAAERILSETDVVRFFTPASGALFALKAAYIASPTSETLLRSDDGGTTWRTVELPPGSTEEYERRSVEVDPLDHTVLYVSGADGLYKSDDDAASWRLILQSPGRLGSVVVSGADNRLVYTQIPGNSEAGRPRRVLRSRDGGASWDELSVPPCGGASIYPHPTDPASVVVAMTGCSEMPAAFYVSHDEGLTWSHWLAWPEADTTGGRSLSGPSLRGGTGVRPERVYAAFSSHSLAEGLPLFRTDDAGGTWQRQIVGPREEVAPSSPKWQGGKFWSYVADLDYDPNDPDRVYVGLYGSREPLRTSGDGGETWTALPLPGGLRNIGAVALGVDRQNLYVATRSSTYANDAEGVYRVPLGIP